NLFHEIRNRLWPAGAGLEFLTSGPHIFGQGCAPLGNSPSLQDREQVVLIFGRKLLDGVENLIKTLRRRHSIYLIGVIVQQILNSSLSGFGKRDRIKKVIPASLLSTDCPPSTDYRLLVLMASYYLLSTSLVRLPTRCGGAPDFPGHENAEKHWENEH